MVNSLSNAEELHRGKCIEYNKNCEMHTLQKIKIKNT